MRDIITRKDEKTPNGDGDAPASGLALGQLAKREAILHYAPIAHHAHALPVSKQRTIKKGQTLQGLTFFI